jgi:hypothetical protein
MRLPVYTAQGLIWASSKELLRFAQGLSVSGTVDEVESAAGPALGAGGDSTCEKSPESE